MPGYEDLFQNIFDKTLSPRWPNGLGDSDQHLLTLFGLVLQIKAKNILELGVRFGDTSEPLLAATSIIGGHLTAVDIQPTNWLCPLDLKPNYTFVQSEAILFLENEVSKKSYYDLIYVDDWHAYEHVKRELELIDKLTDKKSIILLHDLMAFSYPEYHLPLEAPVGSEWSSGGPTRAVFELDNKIWEKCTIPVNNGLTILRKI